MKAIGCDFGVVIATEVVLTGDASHRNFDAWDLERGA